MHGGSKGSGAPTGRRNGNFRTGTSTKEGLALIRHLNMLARQLRRLRNPWATPPVEATRAERLPNLSSPWWWGL